MLKKIYIATLFSLLINLSASTSFSDNHIKTVSINVMPNLKPISFVNKEGKPDGFFVQILQEIAKKYNFKIKYHTFPWDKGLEAVKNKEIDLMPCVIKTKQREVFLDYTDEIVKTSWGEIFLHIDSKIESLLDLKGKRIGVMKSDQNAANLKKITNDFNLKCSFVEVPSQKDIIPLIERKEVDAGVFFNTFNINSRFVKNSTIVFNPVNLYFATAKNTNKELLALLSFELREWKKDKNSPYYQIINKSFGKTNELIPKWLKITGAVIAILCLFFILATIALKYLVNLKTKQLKKSQHRLKLVMESTKDGIWDWDINANKIYWSDQAYIMLGYEPNQIPLTYEIWRTLVHPDDLKLIEPVLKEALSTKKAFVFEMRYKQKNNTWKWVLGRGQCVETDINNNAVRLVGSHTDISEQKKTQEFLEEQKKQFRVIFDKAPSIMFLVNRKGKLIKLNKTGQLAFNKSEQASLGLLGGELFNCINSINGPKKCCENEQCRSCPIKNTVTKTFETKKNINNVEISIGMQEKQTIKTKSFLLSTAILNFNKKPTVLINLIDISIQKQTEEKLMLAKEKAEEADNLKTAFLASLSHEIRTPMNGILGFASLLKESNLTDIEHVEYIKAIETSGARMLNIINDLVDISKIESGQITIYLEQTSINDLIEEIYVFFHPTAVEKNIQLISNIALDDKDSYINIDRNKIAQVLTNLINNAFKFTETGTISFGYTVKNNFLEFYVRDTGIGIPESMHEIIFERFRQIKNTYSAQTEGSGLGLSISQAFIVKHGGKLWLQSKENEGSVFYFTLPYKPVNPDNNIKEQTTNYNLLPNMEDLNILIAEDDLISYTLLDKMLQKYNFTTIYAANGQEAIEIAATTPKIDLILMDLKMPELSGIEATKRIKETHPNIPIIIQSAFTNESDMKNASAAGCDDFISKPIDKIKLLNSMQRFLTF